MLSVELSLEMRDLGLGGGWNGCMDGRGRKKEQIEVESRDIVMPVGMESPPVPLSDTVKTVKPSLPCYPDIRISCL